MHKPILAMVTIKCNLRGLVKTAYWQHCGSGTATAYRILYDIPHTVDVPVADEMTSATDTL